MTDVSRRRLMIAGVAAVLLALGVWRVWVDSPKSTIFSTGDTRGVVVGVRVAGECLRDGTWRRCAFSSDGGVPEYAATEGSGPATIRPIPGSAVGRFNPLPYLVAGPAAAAGLEDAAILRLFGLVSLASMALMVGLPWMARARAPGLFRHRGLVAAALLTGPLVAYGPSTWNEVPSAALIAAAVVAVAARAPVAAAAALVFLAGLSKEAAPLMVAGLCLAVAPKRDRSLLPVKASLVGIGAGSAAALAGHLLFNQFRFGAVENVTRLYKGFTFFEPVLVVKQAVTLLVSPNGGLLVYWPFLFVASFLIFRRLPWGPRWWRRPWAAEVGLVVAVVGFHWAVTSAWYSPFGWWAWGTRLLLPVLPGALVALVVVVERAAGAEREPAAAWRISPRWAAALLIAAALGAAHYGARWNADGLNRFFEPPPCQDFDDAGAMVDCNLDVAWGRYPAYIGRGYEGLATPGGAVSAALGLGAVLVLLGHWHDTVAAKAPPRPLPRVAATPSSAMPKEGVP